MKNWILLKEAALSFYRSYNNNVPQNLSKEEFIALQNLSKNKDLIIQKSDEGNSVVTAQRQDYLKKMDGILSDQKKFSKVRLKDGTILLSIKKNMLIRFLKNLRSLKV